MSGASSTLSLTTFRWPALACARRSIAGETMRHGPHHGAQKSTTTGTDALVSVANDWRSAATNHGSFVPHAAHWGTPSAVGRTRLRLPQLGQVTIVAAISAKTVEHSRVHIDEAALEAEPGAVIEVVEPDAALARRR